MSMPQGTNKAASVLVKNSIPCCQVECSFHCREGVEVMAVLITLKDMSLTVYSLYVPHCCQTLEVTELFTAARSKPFLLGGNFKAHN